MAYNYSNIFVFLRMSSELCNPGEYSASGFAPCDAAPRGTYVEGKGKTSYTACPSGTTTMTEGTKSRYDCGSMNFFLFCNDGTVKATTNEFRNKSKGRLIL